MNQVLINGINDVGTIRPVKLDEKDNISFCDNTQKATDEVLLTSTRGATVYSGTNPIPSQDLDKRLGWKYTNTGGSPNHLSLI